MSRVARKIQSLLESWLSNWFRKQTSVGESLPLWLLIQRNIRTLSGNIGDGSKKLGERRDGLLLGAGVLYLLGYLTWALYGLINGIGFIAVFDLQYFAAGMVPALLIALFLVVVRLLGAVQTWLKFSPTRTQFRAARVLALCFILIMPFASLLFFLEDAVWGTAAIIAASAIGYLSQMLARNRGSRLLQGFVIWGGRSYAVLGLFLWVVYVEGLMPLVPTEWGGARPRCILCDVDSAQLSPETRLQIVGDSGAAEDQKVVRSRSLNLIFDGSEYLFLTEQGGRPSSGNPIYRLRKDAVKAVFACPRSNQTTLNEAR